MAVENEIVEFSAKIQLDQASAAEVQKAFNDTTARCNELHDSINKTNDALLKMRLEGKENTDQYKALEASLKADTKELRNATKEADAYAQKLGTSHMSIKQLQAQAKQLRSALASMHKEADPKLWDKYQKELKATEARLKELKGGSEKTGGVMKSLGAKIAGGFAVGTIALKAFNGLLNLGKKALNDMKTQTQQWGDKWAIAMAGLNAGWDQFIANMAAGSKTIKGSIADAVKAAREAAALTDELFERNNSYKIAEAAAQDYINQQNAIAMNSSKSAEERMAALDNIIGKEKELAATRQSIAEQELDAAKKNLQARTSLSEKDLQLAIDAYEQNRDAFALAQEYNNLLEKQDALKLQSLYAQNAYQAAQYGKQLQDVNDEMAKTPAIVQQYAQILRQYNLGNDDMVKSYVDAKVKVQQAVNDVSAVEAGQARRRGTLQNQINADAKAASEKAYNDAIKLAEKSYKEQLLLLKQQLADKTITQTQYDLKSQAAETAAINAKIAINKKYGKDTIDLDTKLVDQRLALQKQLEAALQDDGFDQWMADQAKADEAAFLELCDQMEAELDAEIQETFDHFDDLRNKAKFGAVTKTARISLVTEGRDNQLAELEEMHDMMMLSEEEYLERKKLINEEAAKEIAEISMESWKNSVDMAGMFLDQMSNLVGSLREAEMTNLDAQMEAELAAAGDNAEERERIENEYQQKKLETEKKYADVDMGINIAKTIADGALAIMKAFADLGPIAGGIMAALIGATTIAQIATIVAQRNAIKNASVTSGSSSAPSSGNVVGFSEGGYTGQGGRLEVAGVVHRGEYVVPQPELRDPEVASMVSSIERKRRGRTSKNALPGYAEGGFAEEEASRMSEESATVLQDIRAILVDIKGNPIPAYVVLSQLEAQQSRQARFNNVTSLRR